MQLGELIEQLERLVETEGYSLDAEVYLATQPDWPLQFNLVGVVGSSDLIEDIDEWQEVHADCDDVTFGDENVCRSCDDALVKEDEDDGNSSEIIYLVEGGHPSDSSPYAPKVLWDLI